MTYAKAALTRFIPFHRFVRPRTPRPTEGLRGMTNGSVRVSVFGKTDLGRTRDHNEDTFLVADLSTGNASLQPEVRSHQIGPKGSLFMVADGMGGAAAGELANGEIYGYGREHPGVRGMGTTVTAAGIFGSDLYLAQIGDSRAYLIRGPDAVQLTKDQSLMQRLVDAGELTQDEAEQSERRNIILQALGPDPRVKVDLTHQPIRRGDTLILCSDGLSGVVRREEFAQMARQEPDLAALCSALIDLANARGGPDNITVVAARFEGEGLPEANGREGVGHQRYHLAGSTDTSEMPVVLGKEQDGSETSLSNES